MNRSNSSRALDFLLVNEREAILGGEDDESMILSGEQNGMDPLLVLEGQENELELLRPNLDETSPIDVRNDSVPDLNTGHDDNQREIPVGDGSFWSPRELFDRFFAPFIKPLFRISSDNDINIRQTGSFSSSSTSSSVEHNNLHLRTKRKKKKNLFATPCPCATLYFDSEKLKTVVVLSGKFLSNRSDASSKSSNSTSKTTNNIEILTREDEYEYDHYYDYDYESNDWQNLAIVRRICREAVSSYLQRRVDEGTATKLSSLYYELDGYVRMNYTELHKQYYIHVINGNHFTFLEPFPLRNGNDHLSNCFLSGLPASGNEISVAVGALKASDNQQSIELLKEREARFQLYNRRNSTEYQNATKTDTSENCYKFCRIEEVLEIAREHRLQEDLDIIAVYCMRLVSKEFGRVAVRIARHKILNAQLSITPYVDGILLSGYFRFNRLQSQCHNRQLVVRATESGRIVEYLKYDEVPLLPVTKLYNTDDHMQRTTEFIPTENSSRLCLWNCEEYALPNLHCQEWGDFLVRRDYLGQKLVLKWFPDTVECITNNNIRITPNVASIRIDTIQQDNGRIINIPIISNSASISCFSEYTQGTTTSNASITLRIQDQNRLVRDTFGLNATTIHQGSIDIEKVYIDFPFLVRAAAKLRVPALQSQYSTIEETRPILLHEQQYLELVENLISL